MHEHRAKLLNFLSETLRHSPSIAPWHLVRDSQMRFVVSTLTSLGLDLTVLDYGCGNLRLLNALIGTPDCPVSEYVATDIVTPDLDGAVAATSRPRLRWSYRTPDDLRQSPSREFDAVVFMNVIHEVSAFELAIILEDARRLLRDDGLLIVVDMSVLPEGEPRSVPYYAWDVCGLLLESNDQSFISPSGVPILAVTTPRQGIAVFPHTLWGIRSLLCSKRDQWSYCACKLSDTHPSRETEELVQKFSVGLSGEYDLAYLMIMSGHANYRLIQDDARPRPSLAQRAGAASRVIDYFVDAARQMKGVMFADLFDSLGNELHYDVLSAAIAELVGCHPYAFFFPPSSVDWSQCDMTATELLDVFDDRFSSRELEEWGVFAVANECYRAIVGDVLDRPHWYGDATLCNEALSFLKYRWLG